MIYSSLSSSQRAIKLKKVQEKKLVKSNKLQKKFTWNCILAVLNFFSRFKNSFLAIFEKTKIGIWPKIFFSWNYIFGSFSSPKMDFWPFLKLQKMEFGQKNYSWNWFIWFHEFFGLHFFNFSVPLCGYIKW